jgi:retinol dehydrogenase 12
MAEKKTAIVTGSAGAIGTAIARQLLATGVYRVLMIARDERKAERILGEIMVATKKDDISFCLADLSRKREVYHLAELIKGPVQLLVNNAACTPRQRIETPEGIEMQFATNVMGYFWMTDAFLPHLKAGAPSRIVNVASYWSGGLDIDDLEFRNRPYHNDDAYRQSKQANRMLTVAFASRLRHYGVTVNACHPGDVNSALSNNLGFGGHETPDQGARTPVWLATSTEVEGVTGRYFEAMEESACQFSRDRIAIDRLFEICSRY